MKLILMVGFSGILGNVPKKKYQELVQYKKEALKNE